MPNTRTSLAPVLLFIAVGAVGACSTAPPREDPIGKRSDALPVNGGTSCYGHYFSYQDCIADPDLLTSADPNYVEETFWQCLHLLGCSYTVVSGWPDGSYETTSICPTSTSAQDHYGNWFTVSSLASAYAGTDPIYSGTSTAYHRCLAPLAAGQVYVDFDPNCPGCGGVQ